MYTSYVNFKTNIAPIEGWLTKKEGTYFYNYAYNSKDNIKIVEIGSWKGRSTTCFGLGLKESNKKNSVVYAIDPHTGSVEHRRVLGEIDTFPEFLQNIKKAGVSKYITPIRDYSLNAVKEIKDDTIDFIFFDGAHDLKNIRLDFESWFPKLKQNKTFAFHDSWGWPGVHLFTLILLMTSKNIKKPKLVGTVTLVTKVEKNTLIDRVHNIFFILYRILFGGFGTFEITFFSTMANIILWKQTSSKD